MMQYSDFESCKRFIDSKLVDGERKKIVNKSHSTEEVLSEFNGPT